MPIFLDFSTDLLYLGKAYTIYEEKGLINHISYLENSSLLIRQDIEEKILYLRKTFHLGQLLFFGAVPWD